jgi:glucose/arabinose dehydrogenase
VHADTKTMKRAATLSLLLVLATVGLVSRGRLATAAMGVRRVVPCRSANPACWPASFDGTPGGSLLFYGERYSGQIRVKNLRTGSDTLWTTIPNIALGSEQGLLGLALDPRWATRADLRWVYAYYTEDSNPDVNRIIRVRKSGSGVDREDLETMEGAVSIHNGGVIRFGPDGKLYAVTGDGAEPLRSQNVDDPAGKVLRMNRDGSIPSDNPFPGTRTFSFGHRNSFGFAFDPRRGRLWQTENGPQCNDEVNLVIEGGNYAWGPNQSCGSETPPLDTNRDGPSPRRLPKRLYRDTIAVTGAAFCERCGLGARWNGDLIMGAYGPDNIRALELNRKRRDVVGQRVLYEHDEGIVAVEDGPGRRIYFSDSSGIFRLTPD